MTATLNESAYKAACEARTHYRQYTDVLKYTTAGEDEAFIKAYSDALEMAADVAAYDEAKRKLASGEDELIPFEEVTKRVESAETLIGLLKEVSVEMQHAVLFIRSKEKMHQVGQDQFQDVLKRVIAVVNDERPSEIRLLNQVLDPAMKYDIADYVVTECRSKTDIIQDVWDELVKRGLIMWEQTAKDMADMYHDKCKELEALQDSLTKREMVTPEIRKAAKQTAFPCSPPQEAFILDCMAAAIFERENRDVNNISIAWSESGGIGRRQAKERARSALKALKTSGYQITKIEVQGRK